MEKVVPGLYKGALRLQKRKEAAEHGKKGNVQWEAERSYRYELIYQFVLHQHEKVTDNRILWLETYSIVIFASLSQNILWIYEFPIFSQ